MMMNPYMKVNKGTIKAIVLVVLLIVLIILIRRGFKGLGQVLTSIKDQRQIYDILASTTPTDGSEIDTPAIDQFEAQAKTIAQGQYNSMKGFGTDENALFDALVDLNGAQLCKVYQAYGVKEGKDLFGWYQDELGRGAFSTMVHPDIPGCESVFDGCSESTMMATLWEKSGLPLTF